MARKTKYYVLPLLVLLLGVAGTMLAAFLLNSTDEMRMHERFMAEARQGRANITDRLANYQALLVSGRAFYYARGASNMTGAAHLQYVAGLDLERLYTGTQGLGYAAYVQSKADRAALEQRMVAEGARDFRIWPDTAPSEGYPIIYLGPDNARNRAAVGFDMFSESTRRAAMARARDSGEWGVSGRVQLVQEIDNNKQPGFLIYMPVYANEASPPSIAARRAQIQGFVYMPLRAYDLFDGVFSANMLRQMCFQIYDGAVRPENLLYRSNSDNEHDALFHVQLPLEVGGRAWTLVMHSLPPLERESSFTRAELMMMGGLLGTLVMVFGAMALARSADDAEHARSDMRRMTDTLEMRVVERTKALELANMALRTEMGNRQAVEAALAQAQKIEALGQLTGGIAHDFNNMLAIIIGSLDMVRRRLGENIDARVERLLDNAMAGAKRAAELTNRLLVFSRQQPLNHQSLDVNKLVMGMKDMLSRTLGEHIRLETDLAQNLWPSYADPHQLENAILNLALNGRDAMPNGGLLCISTKNTSISPESPEAQDMQPGDYVQLCVADTGVGMSESVRARAFDPFFTTKDVGKGTGLGLSQVYGFVRQSAGHVRIGSREGQGTHISLFLPRLLGPVLAAPEEEKETDHYLPQGQASEIVLVVEDEEQVRRFAVDALRDLGYQVQHAVNGEDALAMMQKLPQLSLLFTDVVMPGMTGPELARRLREARPDLKVLYTTGYARQAFEEQDLLAEGSALLPKPYTIVQLAQAVRRLLDGAAL